VGAFIHGFVPQEYLPGVMGKEASWSVPVAPVAAITRPTGERGYVEGVSAPVLTSELRCPACGHAETLHMPTDACRFFHECASCRALLRPRAGDCCVFCSFGSVPCPPVQVGGGRSCCDGTP
jgi:hypothetical protein